MKKYSVRNKATGIITNSWTDVPTKDGVIRGAGYYEPNFGKPGEYDLIEEDLTAQINAEKLKLEAQAKELEALLAYRNKALTAADVLPLLTLIIKAIPYDSLQAALADLAIRIKLSARP